MEERRAGISEREEMGMRRVVPGRRTEGMARGMRGRRWWLGEVTMLAWYVLESDGGIDAFYVCFVVCG